MKLILFQHAFQIRENITKIWIKFRQTSLERCSFSLKLDSPRLHLNSVLSREGIFRSTDGKRTVRSEIYCVPTVYISDKTRIIKLRNYDIQKYIPSYISVGFFCLQVCNASPMSNGEYHEKLSTFHTYEE